MEVQVSEEKIKKGLYLTAVPIGNAEDITIRALKVLQNADFVYAEERKAGYRLIRSLGIQREDLRFINEHNENEQVNEIADLVKEGHSVAVFSDAGSPVFSDPGMLLVQEFQKRNLPYTALPGASSLVPALTVCGIDMNTFHFAGFLHRDEGKRKHELLKLKNLGIPIFIMETPYRLGKLVSAISSAFGKNKEMIVLADLTAEGEQIARGTSKDILKAFGREKNRKPFVLIIT